VANFSTHLIEQIAGKVAAASSVPAKIILIGSYARGDTTNQSDLDLVVLHREVVDRASEYRRLITEIQTLASNVDLILMQDEEFEWRSLVGGTLPYWAKQEGKVLRDFSS
jgi:uncharacterized protein